MSAVNLAHYVGIVVPHCSLTYSVAPCEAQLNFLDGGGFDCVNFSSAYATRGASLSSMSDGKVVSGSFWLKLNSDNSTTITLFAGTTTVAGTTTRFSIKVVSGKITIVGTNTSGTTILSIRNNTTLNIGQLYHVLFAVNLATAGTGRIYIDDASDYVETTYTNQNMDLTLADWSYGALPDGSQKVADNLVMSPLWLDFSYIDFNTESNRRKFISSDGRPVRLGTNGETPTGSSPKVYIQAYPVFDGTNLGTGGNFTVQNSGSEFIGGFGTGDDKCFNSLGTCQDLANFDDDEFFLLFGEDVTPELARSFADTYAIPYITSIDYQSAIVSLGDNMGQRGSVTITLRDAPSTDAAPEMPDKYLSERDYDPLDFGTFWGRFKARNPYMRFAQLILYTVQRSGHDGDDYNVESRVYAIESISGPSASGEVRITAKDILKVADGEYAKAPVQSAGFLASDITAIATTATVSPTGILDDYPSTGYVCIGGNEIVSYTKAGGDVLNITRGRLGTTGQTHSAQDRVQLVLVYDAESPDVIIRSLLVDYAGVDGGSIDEDAWAAEVAAYLNTVYTLIITEPTNVRDLVSEIILQIGGAIWWDDVSEQVRLQILKNVATDSDRFNEDNIIFGSLDVAEQENKRITEVSVYFAQHDPTRRIDETSNYASVATVNDEATEALVGGKSIKTIFARGIASGGRTVAERLAQKYLSRYVIPPRRFNFELMKYAGSTPQLGGGYLLGGGDLQNREVPGPFQDEFGNRVEVPIQVTRVNPVGFKYQVEAEEVLFTAYGDDIDPTNHTIVFDVSRNNVNLEETHDSIYATAQSGDTVNCYVNAGVIIGSTDHTVPAFIVGSFAGGVTVNLFVNGRIQGKGGDGGNATSFVAGISKNGGVGGTALYTRQTISVDNQSQIWGGGGGGGGAVGAGGGGYFFNSGGGGAGQIPGSPGRVPTSGEPTDSPPIYRNPGNPGTTESGGTTPFPPVGAYGGDPGVAGQNASGGGFGSGTGGAAGAAVDGTSFVTYVNAGDRRGGLIN